jgi:hypothetical protein
VAAIADRRGIWKVVINIAVEQFEPVPGKRQPDRIILFWLLGQIGYHDHIPAFSLDPSVQNDHPLEIVGARHPRAAAAQRRLRTSKFDHVGDEFQKVAPYRVRGIQRIPSDEVIDLPVVAPVLVLEEFLAHEQGRNSGRRQQQAGDRPASAAGVPGGSVQRVRQHGDPRGIRMRGKRQVLIFEALHQPPTFGNRSRHNEGVRHL